MLPAAHETRVSGDEAGYRSREKKLFLPASGVIPAKQGSISDEEQDAFFSWLARIDQAVATLRSMNPPRLPTFASPTGAEKFLAWKRWVLSHHLFIPMLALTGHALTESSRYMDLGERSSALECASLAARLRKGCGALFLYSVDFQPCAPIYCSCIRSHMPAGFSGYEIRERQYCYQPAIARFNDTFSKTSSDSFTARIRQLWTAADLRYHKLHERCMQLAVVGTETETAGHPQRKPESLRAIYRRNNGEVPEIGEAAFAEYDRWFAIERRDGITRFDYVYEVCDVIDRLLSDLLIGHRLDDLVTTELIDSIKAVLVVFGRWAGPIHSTSPFFPRQLRGE
jgi:hypothetical protein